MTVAAILRSKGHEVAAVAPTESIAGLSRTLAERRIGAILVRDAAGQLLGIVSERDIVRALAAHGAKTLEMSAAQLMTSKLITVSCGTTIEQAMAAMTDGRVRHLPVLDHGELVGIVSIGDIVKARIDQQAQEVDSLKAYVSGGV